MGYHTLISVSHDLYKRDAEGVLEALNFCVSSASKRSAKNLSDVTHGAMKVVATKHSSDEAYIVPLHTDGFPTQMPYDDELEVQNTRWKKAYDRTKAYLQHAVKIRTTSNLRDLIVELIEIIDGACAENEQAQTANDIALENLSDPNWIPSRKDYEKLTAAMPKPIIQNKK